MTTINEALLATRRIVEIVADGEPVPVNQDSQRLVQAAMDLFLEFPEMAQRVLANAEPGGGSNP